MTHANAEHPSNDELFARFAPIFERIAQSQPQREAERQLPFEPITWLKQAGFGALRVLQAEGGLGASIPQLTRLWIALAKADSNVTQALRGHFTFVEDYLNKPPSELRSRWLKRFADGQLVGNGWSETSGAKVGLLDTRVTPDGDGWRVDGTKFYSTGSIYADWIDVLAENHEGTKVIAAVSTHQAEVERSDDWDGFGQRTTGTGTTLFKGAYAAADEVNDFDQRFPYQTAFYQLNLVSALVGVGQAIERDIAHEVATRNRMYSHGNAARSADDPQVLQVVGRIAARNHAAQAAALETADALQQAFDSREASQATRDAANWQAELASAKAQVVVAELVLESATSLFNALGASAVRAGKQLDRHWRNARTLASHNPLIYKERIIGDWSVNQRQPESYRWAIGEAQQPTPAQH